ncbi:hypothetical protein CB0940_03257 [Cercospora beticola]|uniref:Increased recombination centers protein 6 n=1 Tax=Cercospora beticola TaxID=122368 RepID=A0A2G5I1S8_CERBT|nr:hypothetical protein CB0940_03257 [Cercospora beticola]PIA98729.1 hypothetical protein CB0940_03257 [Cercospora beticola]WPB00430.1 hypothetical protein RHO25_005049 [Cercospora beticola]CAK1361357.1 unnamed protein product [Cercospora beticola]
MDIKHSRHILLLGTRESGTLDVVKDLTGSAPDPHVDGSTAGLTHEWNAETAYYKANVPIWIDEVSEIQSWKTEFVKAEAKEVVDEVGAWIYCFQRQADGKISPEVEEALKSIKEVVDQHSLALDTTLLAVAKPHGKQAVSSATANQEEQEDLCMQYGFEYVDYSATGKNEYGEKVGFERLKEVLETNEWASGENDEVELDDLDFTAEDFGDFGTEEAEMTAELFGMKAALNEEDDPDTSGEGFTTAAQAVQVDDLDKLMSQLLAVREQSAGLPEEERKKKAAKAVKDIMDGNPNLG